MDGIDAVLETLNKYNEVLDDGDYPTDFHALFEVKNEVKTEDKKSSYSVSRDDRGDYQFSAKEELVITKGYKGLKPEEVAKSFHADTYCFDSRPEREVLLAVHYERESQRSLLYWDVPATTRATLRFNITTPIRRIRQYYPDFLARMEDGSYQLIEVKGDDKIDDPVVQGKSGCGTRDGARKRRGVTCTLGASS